jgi:hypothetical protein
VNLGFKLKTEQLQVVEMFWQLFSLVSALTSRRAWIQTHARLCISLNNTVAIPDQFETFMLFSRCNFETYIRS